MRLKFWHICFLALLVVFAWGTISAGKLLPDPVKEAQQKTLTRYSVDGRPVNQAQDSKGFHRITGRCKLVNGVDTVTLNTSSEDGKQDVAFMADSTYLGKVWALTVAHRAKSYWVLPIAGNKFVIVSSDSTDTATVRFQVEGE